MNNPMKDRRDALDLAIVILDAERIRLLGLKIYNHDLLRKSRIIAINKAIKILTGMKDEGPLL